MECPDHVARAARRQIVLRDGQILIDTTDPEEAIAAIDDYARIDNAGAL